MEASGRVRAGQAAVYGIGGVKGYGGEETAGASSRVWAWQAAGYGWGKQQGMGGASSRVWVGQAAGYGWGYGRKWQGQVAEICYISHISCDPNHCLKCTDSSPTNHQILAIDTMYEGDIT